MRDTKTFTIDGFDKTIEVKELTLREIINFLDPSKLESADIASMLGTFKDNILPKATNLKPNELLDMAPSEINQVWEKFRETNKVFFGLSSRIPWVTELVKELKPAIFGIFGGYVAEQLKRAMLGRQTTDSATSSMPSTSTRPSNESNSQRQHTPSGSGQTQTRRDGKASYAGAVSGGKHNR